MEYGEFRTGSANPQNPNQVMQLMADLLIAIREDLGVGGNHTITTKDILSLSINDPENFS